MSTITAPAGPAHRARPRGSFAWAVKDIWVLTRGSRARTRREPETLADVTIQPIIFVLLFCYVFGNAIRLPGGGNYHEYLIGGMLRMGLARAAVLAGRSIADLLTQVIGVIVTAGVGLAVGWRIHTGVLDALAAFGLALLFGYAFTWAGACLGMVLRSPEAPQQAGFIIFLPLTFISSAFVPTQAMPGWLQPVAEWNPMSALAAATRHYFGNPNPAAAIHAWPMEHPVLAVTGWSLLMLALFAPLAVHLYRRKARG